MNHCYQESVGCASSPGLHRNFLWRIFQVPLQVLFVLGVRYRVRGLEHVPSNSGALLLINHQSYLDPLLVGLPLKRPVSFLARDSLFKVPVIGWILKNTYVMAINRETAGTESIRLSISRMKEGYLVGIFPEGTRTASGIVGELKPGFIALARRTKLPIIPVGIAGAYQVMPRGSFFIHPAPVSVYFGEPLDPQRVSELTQRGHEAEFLVYVTEKLQESCDMAVHVSEKLTPNVPQSPAPATRNSFLLSEINLEQIC